MAHNTSKRIGAVLGIAAAGLMVLVPLTTHALQAPAPGTPGSGVYVAFTLPPTMSEGQTQTTTVPPAVPEISRGPVVKAPHR
jgi:hypothetical protein